MGMADRIRKQGFRKWYERELLSSHAHLVLTFLCAIGIFAAFEAYSRHAPMHDQLVDAAAVAICTAVGVWSMRRYLYLLMHAEAAANQAVCQGCQSYGRFDVDEASADGTRLRLRCRRCGHRWTMEF